MQCDDTFTQGRETFTGRLDQQQTLAVAADLRLPAIGRHDSWKAIDAGGKALLHQRRGDALGAGFVGTGAQDQNSAHLQAAAGIGCRIV